MKKYGLPYMGSKSKIAEKICKIFPKAENFYDLFGGGFSITHCMVENRGKDFKRFHFNEIRSGACDLIKASIAGKYSYENFKPEWISREEFFKRKENDFYIKICWSFGNSGEGYLFGSDIEDYKKSMHNAIVLNDFDDTAKKILGMEKFKDGYDLKKRRLFLYERIRALNRDKTDGELKQLQQLQQLQRLERLQQLERLGQLNFYQGDYRKVKIEKDSVVYCDIPYYGTGEYDNNKTFDHREFFYWAKHADFPLFVSEYNINQPFLKLIYKINIRSTLAGGASCQKTEKLYGNKFAIEKLKGI